MTLLFVFANSPINNNFSLCMDCFQPFGWNLAALQQVGLAGFHRQLNAAAIQGTVFQGGAEYILSKQREK